MLFKLIAIALSCAFITYCLPEPLVVRKLSARAQCAWACSAVAVSAVLLFATISVAIEVNRDFKTADPAVVWQRIQQITEARHG